MDAKSLEKIEKLNVRYVYATRKYIVYLAAVALLALGLVAMVIVPQIQRSFSLYQSYQREQRDLASLRKKAVDLANVSSSADFARASQVDEVLPSKKPLLELLTTLNQAAGDSQVVFTKVQLSPGSIASESAQTDQTRDSSARSRRAAASAAARTEYNQISVEMVVQGSLVQINSFLENVEKIAPATTITAMNLNKQTRRTANVQEEVFEAEVIIQSYYFTQSISAAIDAPLPALGQAEEAVLDQLDSLRYARLATQEVIIGGGLEDLFGVGGGINTVQRVQQSLEQGNPVFPESGLLGPLVSAPVPSASAPQASSSAESLEPGAIDESTTAEPASNELAL